MKYRRLGRAGLQVSEFSLGSWVTFSNQVDKKLAVEMMTVAYDAGINFFDNAEVYASGASEEIMGDALKELGWGRDTYCVSSKVFWGGEKVTQRGLNRKHVFDACHAALKRLKVDYLDLYFCHRPDYHTPIEETVRAMTDLVRQGKVMYWGTSEWDAASIAKAHGIAKAYGLEAPVMEQPEYNLFHRERVEVEYHSLYEDGLGTTIWSPLASGVLTGKYRNGIPDGSRMSLENFNWLRKKLESEAGQEKVRKAALLEDLAVELGTTLTKLSLAWCLKNPNVSTVILGASKVSQLKENLNALDSLALLTDEVMERIEAIVDNKPVGPVDYL